MGLSQAPAFTHAYLQRLGGHIDEARRTLGMIERGEMLQRLGVTEREEAISQFSDRVAELEKTYIAIAESPPLLQPLVMLQHADTEIARRAWDAFTPAIPVDAPSLVYTGIGVVVALLIYELVKSPAALFRRRPSDKSRMSG